MMPNLILKVVSFCVILSISLFTRNAVPKGLKNICKSIFQRDGHDRVGVENHS